MTDTTAARPQLAISGSLLDPGQPSVVADPAVATQADAARAYAATYGAWEGCAANLGAMQGILEADGWAVLGVGPMANKPQRSGISLPFVRH